MSAVNVYRSTADEGGWSKPMQVDIIPTSTAAHILRRDPICLGQQIKELYVDKNGAKLRELLAHDDSMQVDGNSNDGSSDSG